MKLAIIERLGPGQAAGLGELDWADCLPIPRKGETFAWKDREFEVIHVHWRDHQGSRKPPIIASLTVVGQ